MWRSIGSLTVVAVLLAGCGGGEEVVMPPPQDLQYAGSTVGLVGTPLGPLQPTVTGTVTLYDVSPALPAGLSLSPASGVISGTPLASSPSMTYTVTASNNGGVARADLTLAVDKPLTKLSYAGPVSASVGTALTRLEPVVSGDADNYSVSPRLPAGLVLDPASGVLSGTPTHASPETTYAITASNGAGSSVSFDLSLTVGPPLPGVPLTGAFRDFLVVGLGYVSGAHGGLTDAHGQYVYEGGQSITFKVGNVSLGTVSSPKMVLTPVDLIANGTGTSAYVLNVLRFLMMLDQDGNPSNGIQISAAVSAAAASWAQVDFGTADLPMVLGPLIQLASAADGTTHTLPDAASAQARLRAEFYCTDSGLYLGAYAAASAPNDLGPLTVEVYPDGSVHSIASPTVTLPGFDVLTANALNASLDGSFTQTGQNPSITLVGSLSDAAYLSGTYTADAAGTFQAVGDTGTSQTYKFSGSYTKTPVDSSFPAHSGLAVLGMDDSNQVSGGSGGALQGTVTGTTFTGTIGVREAMYGGRPQNVTYSVSGTFANTSLGYTLEGEYFDIFGAFNGGANVKFSTVGCRSN